MERSDVGTDLCIIKEMALMTNMNKHEMHYVSV